MNLKRSLLATSILLTSSTISYADVVPENDIDNVAKNFFHKLDKSQKAEFKIKLRTSSNELLRLEDDAPTLQLIHLEPAGWVIVSTDDIAEPIIAYSLNDSIDDIDNLPPQMIELLSDYDKEIKHARSKPTKAERKATKSRWKELRKDVQQFRKGLKTNTYLSSSEIKAAIEQYWEFVWEGDASLGAEENEFVISTSSADIQDGIYIPGLSDEGGKETENWGQCGIFNNMTPVDGNSRCWDSRVFTGCVATAMAQIMRANRWPANTGSGIHTYTHPDYGQLQANFGATDYNVASSAMTNAEIAQLMFHAGIAVEMDYGADSSGAFSADVPAALENHFNYHTGGYTPRTGTTSQWEGRIIQNLRQGFPVYYRGTGTGGHAFVIDGFSTEGGTEFEINWGWNGSANGYYRLSDLTPGSQNFNNGHHAIFHIKPNNDTFRDMYESDNSAKYASNIQVNSTQIGHSIDPDTDQDWVTFYLDNSGTTTIETLSSANQADTRMWLYNSQGTELAFNDDGGTNYLSRISLNLDRGRYYIKIDEYENNDEISSYDIRVTQ